MSPAWPITLAIMTFAPAPVLSPEAAAVAGRLELSRRIVRGVSETGQDVAGYLRVSNPGDASDALVAAECDCAERIEFHVIRRSATGGGMTAEPILDVPAHGQLDVRPGSDLHLMLIGYDPSKAVGGKVRLKLVFRDAGAVASDFALTEDSRAAWSAFD